MELAMVGLLCRLCGLIGAWAGWQLRKDKERR